jgi:hypothetical protein
MNKIALIETLLHHQARWPSGLRRQLKVHPIRWSERAWVQIPLWSISFCSLYDYLKDLEKVVTRIKNHLFAILDMGFADELFCARGMARRCEKTWRCWTATMYISIKQAGFIYGSG